MRLDVTSHYIYKHSDSSLLLVISVGFLCGLLLSGLSLKFTFNCFQTTCQLKQQFNQAENTVPHGGLAQPEQNVSGLKLQISMLCKIQEAEPQFDTIMSSCINHHQQCPRVGHPYPISRHAIHPCLCLHLANYEAPVDPYQG